MIVAIEGTSAAGKTRWCETHAAGCYVPEAPPGPAPWWRTGAAVLDAVLARLG